MELRHLRYFVAVAEQQHFGRAAALLHVSQSPLSRQMQQLAAEVGAPLFEPDGRGVRLSAVGRVFLDGARQTLARAQRAVADAQEAARGQLGTLDVAFEGGSGFVGLLPEIVAEFRARHPRLTLSLKELPGERQLEALRSGELALGCCNLPPPDTSIRSLELFRDPVAVMVCRSHPLARRAWLRARDLAGQTFLDAPIDSNRHLHDEVVARIRALGVELSIERAQLTAEAMLTMVASNAGLAFGTESLKHLLGEGRVAVLALRDVRVELRGLALWRAADENSPLVRPLIDVVRAVVARSRPGRVATARTRSAR